MSVEKIIIRKSPGETHTALLSDERLVELHIDRIGRPSLVGNIYLGRVQVLKRNLEAAFVSIGEFQDGFLALPEVRPEGKTGGCISDFINEGDSILVQVLSDPVEGKGAKLTTHIHLLGTYLVFRPLRAGISVSRRITNQKKIDYLFKITSNLTPKDGGFIVRTNAVEALEKEIDKDATLLIECWRKIQKDIIKINPPGLVYGEVDPACRSIRNFNNGELKEVIVDGADTFCGIKEYCNVHFPWSKASIISYKGPGDIFEYYGIAEQIEIAFSTKVDLMGGGYLIISNTPALCTIDVNTGNADGISREQTAFNVNLEAATEVALQIRLRNLSGLIVVDFVSLKKNFHKKTVLKTLKEAAFNDPLGVNIAGFTRLGLVEMTRKRIGLSLEKIVNGSELLEKSKSAESCALDALRQVMSEFRNCVYNRGKDGVLIRAQEKIIEQFEGKSGGNATAATALSEVQDKLGLIINLEADRTFLEGQYEVLFGMEKLGHE